MVDRGSRQRASVVTGLLDLAEHFGTPAPLREKLQALCSTAVGILGCDRSSVFMYRNGRFEAFVNEGNPPDIAAGFPTYRVSRDDALASAAFEKGSYVMVNDARTHPALRGVAERARIEAIVLAPLTDRDHGPEGFLTAEYNENPGTFDSASSSLVLGLAHLAELAVATERENERRVASDRELARTLADLKQANQRRRELLAELAVAERAERLRVGAAIHDDPLQTLTAAVIRLDLLEHRRAVDDPLRADLGLVKGLLEDGARSLRQIAVDLHDGFEEDRPLDESIGSVLEKVAGPDVRTTFVYDCAPTARARNRLVVFQITREAIFNAFKHASASCIRVEITDSEAGVLGRVTDDGSGLELANAGGRTGHLGIPLMRERAELTGGWLRAAGRQGVGTVVEFWIPEPEDRDRASTRGTASTSLSRPLGTTTPG